jgi:SpoVK/Ycf46/Vps4 family AAA+-type ATPase
LDIPLLKVTSTELISGVSGESEENIRGIFDKAIVNNKENTFDFIILNKQTSFSDECAMCLVY